MPKLTYGLALTEQYFHFETECAKKVEIGPRGGVKHPKRELLRRGGKTQTWKTRPNEFRIPVRFGFRGAGQITEDDIGKFHTGMPEQCDVNETTSS